MERQDAALIELLQSYEAALELADRAREVACAVIDAYVAGVSIEDSTIEQFIAQAERAEHGVARLRAMVATYRSQFTVH